MIIVSIENIMLMSNPILTLFVLIFPFYFCVIICHVSGPTVILFLSAMFIFRTDNGRLHWLEIHKFPVTTYHYFLIKLSHNVKISYASYYES